jgi:hypothetical protein
VNIRNNAEFPRGAWAYHVERGVERQTLEEAMEWVWKRQ